MKTRSNIEARNILYFILFSSYKWCILETKSKKAKKLIISGFKFKLALNIYDKATYIKYLKKTSVDKGRFFVWFFY